VALISCIRCQTACVVDSTLICFGPLQSLLPACLGVVSTVLMKLFARSSSTNSAKLAAIAFDNKNDNGHAQKSSAPSSVAEDAEQKMDGFVVRGFKNGWYKGEMCHGVLQGHGHFAFLNGESYEGTWLANRMSGHGKYNYKDGSYYEGEYLFGKKHGIGRYTPAIGEPYMMRYEKGNAVNMADAVVYNSDLREPFFMTLTTDSDFKTDQVEQDEERVHVGVGIIFEPYYARSGKAGVIVSKIVPGGSAYKDGRIQPGDRVYAITDDYNEEVVVLDEHIDNVLPLIEGLDGTTVQVTFQRDAGIKEDSKSRLSSKSQNESKNGSRFSGRTSDHDDATTQATTEASTDASQQVEAQLPTHTRFVANLERHGNVSSKDALAANQTSERVYEVPGAVNLSTEDTDEDEDEEETVPDDAAEPEVVDWKTEIRNTKIYEVFDGLVIQDPGKMQRKEFHEAVDLLKLRLTPDQADALWRKADPHLSGWIGLQKFALVVKKRLTEIQMSVREICEEVSKSRQAAMALVVKQPEQEQEQDEDEEEINQIDLDGPPAVPPEMVYIYIDDSLLLKGNKSTEIRTYIKATLLREISDVLCCSVRKKR
jgi:hypothetical protein